MHCKWYSKPESSADILGGLSPPEMQEEPGGVGVV